LGELNTGRFYRRRNQWRRNFGRITKKNFTLRLLLFEENQKIITPKSKESEGVLVAS
jgi:hypothetical protein